MTLYFDYTHMISDELFAFRALVKALKKLLKWLHLLN